MEINLATAWEAISDEIPDSDALLSGDTRRSWREYEDRAARIATALSAADLPVGAKDGSQSAFVADVRGTGWIDVAFKPCLKPSDDQLTAALAIAYHSDGNTHGPSPGEMGHTSHVQIFAVLPGPDEE